MSFSRITVVMPATLLRELLVPAPATFILARRLVELLGRIQSVS